MTEHGNSKGQDEEKDLDLINKTHNMARYFVESRQVAWVLLIFTLIWGVYSYNVMEKRKDPLYSNLFGVAVCQWPGASAEKIEQLITRRIEEKIAENKNVVQLQSISRSNVSIVTVKIDDRLKDTMREFDDLAGRLSSMSDLPNGASSIKFIKDYDDITTLMLTVASPKEGDIELSLRARNIQRAIDRARMQAAPGKLNRVAIIACFPRSTPPEIPQRQRDIFLSYAVDRKFLSNATRIDGVGFVGIDADCGATDEQIRHFIDTFALTQLKVSHLHPDVWEPAIIRTPAECKDALEKVPGDKYSYKELERVTDLIKRSLQAVPQVSKITRSGVLAEQINLEFSQERLASYGILPVDLRERLQSHNIQPSGGLVEVDGKNLPVRASGEFKNEQDIANVFVTTSSNGTPVYMRDIVEISRDYESPAHYLNFFSYKDKNGHWQRTRAVTMAVYMRNREHIDKFGAAVNKCLTSLKSSLPDDIILTATADQPKQVEDNIELFMMSLYEAVVLVIVAALIGFWEWRSALLIALSIPATLTMTFGMMSILGIDLQQCSIASLIISLGLLVDDPVVAGDAIKRGLADGHSRLVAAWLGPTKLAHAIMFATLTNIAAYLPLLMISGEIGQFIVSLPIVITLSLIASRIVSMTFVPMLGYYLLRAPAQDTRPHPIKDKIVAGYLRGGEIVLRHRVQVFGLSIVLLLGGFALFGQLKSSFFPNDVFDLSWVDVWLPEDAPLSATNSAALHVEQKVRETIEKFAKDHTDTKGQQPEILDSISTFVGGSGPRFWSTVVPETDQLNYAQVIIKVKDKHQTAALLPHLQQALSQSVPEARCDVRQLEGGKPIGIPVAIRISGSDSYVLHQLAARVSEILRECPIARRVRDDWGAENFAIKLAINSDRANLAGLTNQDVADSTMTGLIGNQLDVLRQGDKQIPIVVRLRSEESAQVQSMSDLYVYSVATQQKVPLPTVATMSYGMEPEKIRRRNQFRTITVGCFTAPDVLPSEVMEKVRDKIEAVQRTLPPGYRLEIGGEEEEEKKSFAEMAVVMAVSIIAIFICLVLQFKNAIKPLLVFAGVPFGILGALVGLLVMNQPFGFPAFMGVASLTGVIVSHVIVLFDFIESGREEGMPLQQALLHSSMVRLRPVLITVGATVLGFIPLAAHGGPLWEPLCYAQIGGLTFATVVTLGLVPIIYAIAVLDLKLIKWDE